MHKNVENSFLFYWIYEFIDFMTSLSLSAEMHPEEFLSERALKFQEIHIFCCSTAFEWNISKSDVLYAPTPHVTWHVFLAGGKKDKENRLMPVTTLDLVSHPLCPWLNENVMCDVSALESDTNPNFARVTCGDTRSLQSQDRLINFTSRRRTILSDSNRQLAFFETEAKRN